MRRSANVSVCVHVDVCVPFYPSSNGEQIWLRLLALPIGRGYHYNRTVRFTQSEFVARLFSSCVSFYLWHLTHAYDDDSRAYNDISNSLFLYLLCILATALVSAKYFVDFDISPKTEIVAFVLSVSFAYGYVLAS